MNTQQMLLSLEDFYAQRDYLALTKQEALDSVMTPEIKAQIEAIMAPVKQQQADIETEFAQKSAAVSDNIEKLEADVKAAVLEGKETVKGTVIMAVYAKGRAGGWDTKALDGYAAAHPEIMPFKKPDGDPSVSFRAMK